MSNLATLLDVSAGRYGERDFLVAGTRRLTFAEVSRRSAAMARRLVESGVSPGDKVALSCPNVPEFTIAYWAVLRAGAVVVPLNVLLRAREIAYHLDDSDAVAYLVYEDSADPRLAEAAREGFDNAGRCDRFWIIGADEAGETTWCGEALTGPASFDTVTREDGDTAVILYTSGTTGRPKGAELTHRNLLLNARAAVSVYELDPGWPDTHLLVAPLFHSLGQTCVQNASTLCGGTIVMVPRFDAAQALRLMLDEHVTIFAGVPTMFWALLRALGDVPDGDRLHGQLRVAASGGSALPIELHKEFEARLGTSILEGYGLSETSPMASHTRLGEPVRAGSIGRPIDGVEMKLIADDWTTLPDDPQVVGEIAIRGHNVMKGYYKRPEATAEAVRDGWFRTGDLARKDADGFYHIVGRSKDLIIRGGYNVYPREIEEVFLEHPAVSLVAVIGVPHASHGQEIKAVVVPAEGHEAVRPEDLVAWGRRQLAAYKYPRIVELRERLPMTPTGKILKREIS
ncbi:long-chain-fatty-acid--CoA ligase [Amycolatopsis thermoflava]|uniref:Long-chain acyl-CoA synthetase n=1 Tax=Amycolatopsis thermoflava TaxID=84480 RepID=A0A3N2H8V3_9PSEU|nr:long-chain fatty acid--CoA ligase [Amycolatopsis thermoflava]ROS44535.1 long-chain acyl-CoA synthetase [Amycolatopsis thermoflava]